MTMVGISSISAEPSIYLVDRADTGLHIVELTGAARAIARAPREGL